MKLINQNKNVTLFIKEDLINKLKDISIKNYPNEAGGFLVGKYSIDFTTLYVTDFILPEKQIKSLFSFERSAKGVIQLFKNLYNQKKEYYIGEWHSHPNGNSMYSNTDLKAMITISESKTVHIENPILLILGISKEKLENFSVYLYDNKGLEKYE